MACFADAGGAGVGAGFFSALGWNGVVVRSGVLRIELRFHLAFLLLCCRCKVCVEAMCGTERIPASERLSSRDHVDFFLASSPSPRVSTTTKLTSKLKTQDNLRVPITVLSALTASSFHISYLS